MDMDMDNMFPRSRLGRLHNDPFAGFGGSHFGFPQFSTLGRRGRVPGGANSHMENDDDFFNRLPSEFRQYIPEGFSGRRAAAGAAPPQQHSRPQPQYYQQEFNAPQQPGQPGHPGQPGQAHQAPQSPSKRLCDAAIQTDDPAGRSEVDCAPPVNLNQHGLRNTMDMGVKSVAEQEQGPRSHSAPPPEQQQLNQQYQQQQQQQHQQQTNQQRSTPPPQYGTQTSPPVHQSHPPQFHKTYYAPQQQAHPQQKQQTPPPQTPGGNVRTIPIFVEGRTEPVINAHKEIPNQGAANAGQPQAHAQAQAFAQASAQAQHAPSQQHQQHQHQHRPSPLNTQQQPQGEYPAQTDAGVGVPPQTPHTQDSIKKIQDIQRDVLELMAKVEQFKGTRQDKEYVYLDEMLTRNLLKLDTIDTQGKDSIRLARKEAIKCIQASVNVLDAKAEENSRRSSGTEENADSSKAASEPGTAVEAETSTSAKTATPQPLDATKIQAPIPLPPPPSASEGANNNQESETALDQCPVEEELCTVESTTSTKSSE